MTTLIVNYADGSSQVFWRGLPMPESAQLEPLQDWGYLPHDYQLKDLIGFSIWTDDDKKRDHRTRWYPKRHGDPETVKTYFKEVRVNLSPAWQKFTKQQFVLACFGVTDMRKFPPLEKAFNSVMADNRVINNNQVWHEGYMPLCMGGNIVKLKNTEVRRPDRKFGKSYKIETLDALKPPPDIMDVNFIKTPWFFSRATVARFARPEDLIPIDNPWSHVIPFPQLDAWNAHVPLLNISNGGVNYVQTARCMIWKEWYVPNPYHPEKERAYG